jgi:hypothetical protein
MEKSKMPRAVFRLMSVFMSLTCFHLTGNLVLLDPAFCAFFTLPTDFSKWSFSAVRLINFLARIFPSERIIEQTALLFNPKSTAQIVRSVTGVSFNFTICLKGNTKYHCLPDFLSVGTHSLKSAQCVSMYFTSCSRSFTSSHTQASI